MKKLIFVLVGGVAAMAIYGAAATKRATSHDGHADRLKRIEALMDEGGVKYRASFFRQALHTVHERVAGLAPVKASTEVAPPAPAKKDTKAEEAKKAADKKAADEKKKKEDEAKKKKKKKKDDKKDEAAPTAASPTDDKKEEKKPDTSADAADGGLSALPIAGANGANTPNTQDPQTADDWIAYLFTNPSFDKVSHFIQLAQLGQVAIDVYDTVIAKMLASDVENMPQWGVMCAGSLPSTQSFQILADVANNAAGTYSDQVKSQAQNYMQSYDRIEYVRFLSAASTIPNDPSAAVDAIQLIERSIHMNLANLNLATATSRVPASNVTRLYEMVATQLKTVSTSASDGSVKANASQAVAMIEKALSSLEATATSTTTSNQQASTGNP